MGSFPYLDLAIGISFIYLLLALVCTTINETIAGIFNSRGRTLEKGIGELLHDKELQAKLYAHPLIKGLQQGAKERSPSYIASNKFALALMDILTGSSPASDDKALQAGIEALHNPATKTLLTAVLQDRSRPGGPQQHIERWYEESMNRVSGWYKRGSQVRIFVLAITVTLLMNADSLRMLKTLWNNPTLSAVLVESAKERLQKGRPDVEEQPMVTYDDPNDPTASTPTAIPERDMITQDERQLLGQVTGWQGEWYTEWLHLGNGKKLTWDGFWSWIGYLLANRLGGWLITILAVSLGAPFWFDTLNKFMNVRNAGKPPAKSSQQTPAATVEVTAS
jgi:hypothetical protein